MLKVETEPLPRWDLSNVYSGLEAEDYRADFARLEGQVEQLARFVDERNIRRKGGMPGTDPAAGETLARAVDLVNDIIKRFDTLGAFIYSYMTTDSHDRAAARETSRWELLDARRQTLDARLRGWIGSLSAELTTLIAQHPQLATHEFSLRHTVRMSRFQMDDELESLAAELCVDGPVAFSKLQGNVTSQLQVTLDRGAGEELLPISVVRNLSFDPDPAVRERAYRAEQAGWKSIRTAAAACLNGVKGAAVTLARRRGRASVLDAALDENRIDRPTLDSLLGAMRESFPVFRRYLAAKARRLGLAKLRWWDIFAPLPAGHRTFSWPAARQFIVEKFGTFSDDMAQYAAAAFDGRWIDAEPRAGKRGGAFCMGVMGVEESRILMNFDGSYEQVGTLAHELGHGYHNHCQRGLEPLRRGAPSTLAETASIFCETLVAEAAIKDGTNDERLAVLEAQLAGATQVCLDISSRFIFESALFARATSELDPDQLCELMLSAQRETYADAIDPDTYHPYMWLWKPHYYQYTENFYNFPYAFGHLFGLGLYAVYRGEGASFVPRYRDLLRSTAQDYAAPLAARFGIDITRPAFWQDSLRIIAEQVERFEKL